MKQTRKLKIVASGLVVLVFCAAGFVPHQWPFNNYPNANQPDSVAVFMANGVFDPADADYVAPTGEDFDRTIMGRDDDEIAERKQESVDYFLERYGVDFSDSDFAQGGAVVLVQSYQDPRWNYRCYKFPGRYVPKAGLIVHDGQWVMFTAADATFFGTWGGDDGTEVPAGTAAVDGEYLVQGTNRFRQGHRRNIYMKFQSVSPIFGASTGNIKFDCRLFSQKMGTGAALGRQELYALQNDLTQVAINNVIQFPAPEWAEESSE